MITLYTATKYLVVLCNDLNRQGRYRLRAYAVVLHSANKRIPRCFHDFPPGTAACGSPMPPTQ